MSNSLQPYKLQHARPPCPSLTPGVYPNPCPSSWWCHPTTSFSVVPFSSCPQSFPASGSFPMSQLFATWWPKDWSFSFNISPSNEHTGLISFRMDWFGLFAVQGTVTSLLQHHSSEASFSVFSFLYGPILTSVHDYWNNITFSKLGFLVKWLTALWRLIKGICWYCVLCQSVIIRRAKSELFQG